MTGLTKKKEGGTLSRSSWSVAKRGAPPQSRVCSPKLPGKMGSWRKTCYPHLHLSLLVSHMRKPSQMAERREPRACSVQVSPEAQRFSTCSEVGRQQMTSPSVVCLWLYPRYITWKNKVANAVITVCSFICTFVFLDFNYLWSKSIK